MESLHNLIRSVIAGETDRQLIFSNDSFFVRLFQRPPKGTERRWRLMNFVLLLTVFIGCIVTIVCSFLFFINDVLLFRPQVRINQHGAFVPTNSCGREYVLFMFNSADVWANTGIQLREGDKIKISASGAFNSSIVQFEKAANDNYKPNYEWYGSTMRSRIEKDGVNSVQPNETTENCMYNTADKAYFGSILYQIQPDAVLCEHDLKTQKIHQLSYDDGKRFHEVRENGILYFAVNDIYLTQEIVKRYEQENTALLAGIMHDGKVNANDDSVKQLIACNKLKLFKPAYEGQDTVLYVAGKVFRKKVADNPGTWFEDNVGEILINIEIQRNLNQKQFALPAVVTWYRNLEERYNALTEASWGEKPGCFIVFVSSFFILLWTSFIPYVIIVLALYGLIVFRKWVFLQFRHFRSWRRKFMKKTF